MEEVTIGHARLYLGDCFEVLHTLRDSVNALITDPEYGNGFQVNKKRSRQSGLNWGNKAGEDQEPDWAGCKDNTPFDPAPFLDFPQVILWGANHYSSRLPDASHWLVWDKKCHTSADNFSDCELAYTNLPGPVRKFAHLWRGIVRAGEENVSRSRKLHPWQKPVALMRWCVDMTDGLVLDPFMGSGTTGLACVELGREFIGVEKERRYFDIACERIEAANSQGRLAL